MQNSSESQEGLLFNWDLIPEWDLADPEDDFNIIPPAATPNNAKEGGYPILQEGAHLDFYREPMWDLGE
jgi:hypothetical protein